MKAYFIMIAVVCGTLAAPHTTKYDRTVKSFLEQLYKMIPMEDVLAEVLEALSEDTDVQESVEYLESKEFRDLAVSVQTKKEAIDVMEFLDKSGIDIYYYVNALLDLLGIPPMQRPPPAIKRSLREGGLPALSERIVALLPLEKMKAFYEEELKTNRELKDALDAIGSDEFIKLGRAVEVMPEYKELIAKLKRRGIDVDAVIERLNDFFGWH